MKQINKKMINISLIIIIIIGLLSLSGCGIKDILEPIDSEIPATGYNYVEPESFEDSYLIDIKFEGNRNIAINPKEKYLNYYEFGKEGNYLYSKEKINLSNFPKIEEYIMSSKVLNNLGKNNGEQYMIRFNIIGGGAEYSTNKLDDVFSELLDVLKINDESIYGKLVGKGEEIVKKYVENIEYDILIERNKEDEYYKYYKYFKFINSEKMEKYEIIYRDMSGSEYLDVLHINMVKIDDDELNKYIDEYGKENEMKKIKIILDQDLTEEYSIGYGE